MTKISIPTLLLGLIAITAYAQTTNEPPVIPGVPVDSLGWINLVLAGLTPIVIASVKLVVPRIPKIVLPFLAPVVGILLTQLEALVAGHSTNLVIGAVVGALGLYLREVVNESKKKLTETTPTPPAS